MLRPLKQFICDTCRQIINKPEEGWIEWISNRNPKTGTNEIHSFNIVHHSSSSHLARTNSKTCYQHKGKSGRRDIPLNDFINENHKMSNILSMLDVGPYHNPDYKGTEITDLRQYVEIMRRLTIPYYEEARQYWEKAQDDGYFDGCTETGIYGIDSLKLSVEKYKDE
jgi:hypothetical protein